MRLIARIRVWWVARAVRIRQEEIQRAWLRERPSNSTNGDRYAWMQRRGFTE